MYCEQSINERGIRIREGNPMTGPITGKGTAVFGMYPHRSSCEHAFSAFKTGGFRDTDISIFFKKNPKTDDRAVFGTVVGGTLGWLAGASTVSVGGREKFFIAGPIASTLARSADGEAPSQLILALLALGVPEYEAKRYEERIEDGEVLMSAHCATSNLVNRARQLFVSTGAEDICSMGDSARATERSESGRNESAGDDR